MGSQYETGPQVPVADSTPYGSSWSSPVSPVERRKEPKAKYIVLFLLTLVTTTLVGSAQYEGFMVGFSGQSVNLSEWSLLMRGLWYSVSALAILGCHELGHYYACRFYRVDASAPYFLPMPSLFGTLGAFIRIRQPLPGKRALFDIGIAGPIAGFVVAVPVLLVGMYLSNVVQLPEHFDGRVLVMGEPLLFKIAKWLTFGTLDEGYDVNIHPVAYAAWFGMLATSLNLLPIGQLDGGHICYAVLGRRSTFVSIGAIACLVGLAFVSLSWIVWAVLMVGMLFVFGPHHPPVWDEHVPLDRTRVRLAVFALLMLVLCFVPVPLTELPEGW